MKFLILPGALLLVALAVTVVPASATTPGAVDTSYGSFGVTVVPGALAGATTVDSTGRSLVLGLTTVNGSISQVTRLTAGGGLDPSFGTNGTSTLSPAGVFYTRMTTDAAGHIYVLGGNATFGAASTQIVVTRLTTAGALDSGFGSGGTTTITVPPYTADSFTVRNDGDVIVSLSTTDPAQKGYLAALTPGGILDTTFGPMGSTGVVPMTTKTFALKVAAALAPISPIFTADTPPNATAAVAYSYTFVATGLPAPTYAVASGSLPHGLSLNATTGVLSGTPDTVGDSTFTVSAANGTTPDAVTPSLTIHVAPTPVAPAFTAASPPPTATVGAVYPSYTFAATGQPAPTFSVASGTLPPGLTLAGATGLLAGTPTGTGGAFTFTVKATNGVSPDAVSGPITIRVAAAPVFTAVSPPTTANIGSAYSYTFAASGTPAPTFAVTSGALPSGLSLTPAGVLSGVPNTAGPASFQVTATNGVAPDATSGTITINVASGPVAPTFTAASPPSTATVGVSYPSYTFTANGNPHPTFSVVGVLPAGLTLNPRTGVLSGVPTTPHTYVFRIKAANGVRPDAISGPITISVARAHAAAAAPTAAPEVAPTAAPTAPPTLRAASSHPAQATTTAAAPDPNTEFVALVADDTGATRAYYLQRYTSSGALDPNFGTGGTSAAFPTADTPTTVVEAIDGSYYVTGNAGQSVFLARVLSNGHFDGAFGTGGVLSGPVESCPPTGASLFVTGSNIYLLAIDTTTTPACGPSPAIVLRFRNGALDSTFGAAGEMRIDSVGPMKVNGPNGGGVQPGGGVLVGLNGAAAPAGASAAVTRVNVSAGGPSIQGFTQLVDDTHFGAATVAPNPPGTYLGPVSATVVAGVTHLYAQGGNHHLFEFTPTGATWSSTDLTAATPGAPILSSAPKAFTEGTTVDVFALGSTGDLVEYRNNGAMGTWTTTDINTAAGATAPKVIATLDPHVLGGIVHLSAATTGGDLVEVDNDNSSGHAWNFYDLTKSAGSGSAIAGGPAAIVLGPTPHVYTRAASNNHLVEYVADNAGGRIWNAYDTTAQAPSGPAIGGDPIPTVITGTPHIYAVSAANGDLIEYAADTQSGHLWNAYDQSAGATGVSKPVGKPSLVLVDGSPYGIGAPIPELWETSATGDLTALVADHQGGRSWNAYDVTLLSGGPHTTGDPSALLNGTTVQVFVLGNATGGGAASASPASNGVTGVHAPLTPVAKLPL